MRKNKTLKMNGENELCFNGHVDLFCAIAFAEIGTTLILYLVPLLYSKCKKEKISDDSHDKKNN